MIFISLGTQKFQLDRLLNEVDKLVELGAINEEVFAQIGNSTYVPKRYSYIRFLEQKVFQEKIRNCSILITHGGVGSIQSGLMFNKNIIVYPRLKEYNEHIDNHQIEIAQKYMELGYCLSVIGDTTLEMCLDKIKNFEPKYAEKDSTNCELIKKIFDFINN